MLLSVRDVISCEVVQFENTGSYGVHFFVVPLLETLTTLASLPGVGTLGLSERCKAPDTFKGFKT